MIAVIARVTRAAVFAGIKLAEVKDFSASIACFVALSFYFARCLSRVCKKLVYIIGCSRTNIIFFRNIVTLPRGYRTK